MGVGGAKLLHYLIVAIGIFLAMCTTAIAVDYEIVSDEKPSSKQEYSIEYIGNGVYRFNYSCGYGAGLSESNDVNFCTYVIVGTNNNDTTLPAGDKIYLPLKYKVAKGEEMVWCTIDVRLDRGNNDIFFMCDSWYEFTPPGGFQSTHINMPYLLHKYTKQVDTIPPTLNLTYADQSSQWFQSIPVVVSASDNKAGAIKVEYKIN